MKTYFVFEAGDDTFEEPAAAAYAPEVDFYFDGDCDLLCETEGE